MPAAPPTLTLELVRAHKPEDAFAFVHADQRYVYRTAAGASQQTAVLPWASGTLLDDVLAFATSPRADPGREARLARALQALLAPTEWTARAQELLAAARQGLPVELCLRTNAAELAQLPWQLLPLPDGRRLGDVPSVRLRLSWTGVTPEPLRTLASGAVDPVTTDGGVLFAWSGAGGSLPVARHRQALQQACERAGLEPPVELAEAGLSELAEALAAAKARSRPPAVLHLLAHGCALPGGVGLALDGGAVGPHALTAVLAPYADTLRLVVLSVCASSAGPPPGASLSGLAQTMNHARIAAVIGASGLLSGAGSVAFTRAFYAALLEQGQELGAALATARQQLARWNPASADAARLQLWSAETAQWPVQRRPYRGLEVFEQEHAGLFFGRDAEARELIDDLRKLRTAGAPRLVIVAGASGTGKSSLVRARGLPGLAGDFADRGLWRPSDAGALPPPRGAGAPALLLLVDQLEELFTQGWTPEQQQQTVHALWALATDAAGSAVIATLRVDFLGRCGELVLPDGRPLDRIAYDERHRVFLGRMTQEQLAQVIEGPAAKVGLAIEPGLTEQLVSEVHTEPGALPLLEFALDELWRRRRPREGLTLAGYRALGGGIGGVLERHADRFASELSEEEKTEARRVLVQLVGHGAGARADTRRRRWLRELAPSGEAAAARCAAMVQRLAGARLVVTGGGNSGEAWVEVAHEELIRRWGTLRDWVDADRQQWVEIETVRGFSEEVIRGARLDRAREARARFGAELGEETLARIAHSEKVLAAEAEAEAARQRELEAATARAEGEARRARRGLGVAVGFLVVACGLGALAWRASGEAQAQAQAAREAAAVAGERALVLRDRALVRAAERALEAEADPSVVRGLLLNVRRPGQTTGWAAAAAEAVYRAPPPVQTFEVEQGRALWVHWVRGGKAVLGGTSRGQLLRWTVGEHDDPEAIFEEGPGVNRLAVASDGSMLVHARHRGTTLFDGDGTPQWTRELSASAGAFSEDAAQLWLVSDQGVVTQLDRAGELLHESPPLSPDRPLGRTFLSPDGHHVLDAPRGGPAELYSWDGTGPAAKVTKLGTPVKRARFSLTGDHLALVTAKGQAQLWSLDDKLSMRVLVQEWAWTSTPVFTPDGSAVLMPTIDGRLQLHALSEATEPQVFPTDLVVPGVAAFSSDGALLFAGDPAGHGQLFSTRDGAPLLTLEAGFLNDAAFDPRGQLLATASDSGQVSLWSTQRPPRPRVLPASESPLQAAVWVPGEQAVRGFGYDGSRWSWVQDGTGEPAARPASNPRSIASTPDLRQVITTDESNVLAHGGATEAPTVLRGLPPELDVLHVNRRADRTLLHSNNTGTLLCPLENMPRCVTLPNSGVQLTLGRFSPDDQHVLTIDHNGDLLLWPTANPTAPTLIADNIATAAFTPDSTHILTINDYGEAELHPTTGQGPVRTLGPTRAVASLAQVSPDGRFALAGGQDGGIWLWDLPSGTPAVELRGHSGPILAADFSPDGQRLVTASADGTARIWPVDGSTQPVVLQGHEGPVNSARFSADGSEVLTASDDGTARIWQAFDHATLVHALGHVLLPCPKGIGDQPAPACPSVEERTRAVDVCVPPSARQIYLSELQGLDDTPWQGCEDAPGTTR